MTGPDDDGAEEVRPPDGPTEIIQTEHSIGQDNIVSHVGFMKIDIHNPVFLISGLSIVLFVAATLLLGSTATNAFGAAHFLGQF